MPSVGSFSPADLCRGFQFTQKLEGMFTDMRISNEAANSFRNYSQRKGVSLQHQCHHQLLYRCLGSVLMKQGVPFEISVNVLTASYWPQPIVSLTPCTLGDRLLGATTMFQNYYDSRHNGRRLTWQGSLGTADVKVRFKARSHDLNVSTHALVVLLLFEEVKDDETLSYSVSQLII